MGQKVLIQEARIILSILLTKPMRQITSFSLTLLCLITLWISPAWGAIYYVSPTGGGDGSRPGSPRSLSWANTNAVAGDTIVMLGGTYPSPIKPTNNGVSNTSRITYQAYGDTDIGFGDVCNGTYPAVGCIQIVERKYATVSGQSFQSPTDRHRYINFTAPARATGTTNSVMINLTGAEGIIVEKTEFRCTAIPHNPCGYGAYINFAYNPYVATNESKFNVLRRNHWTCEGVGATLFDYTEDCLQVEKDAHHNLIEDNIINETYHVLCCTGGSGNTTTHNILRRNRFDNPDHTAVTFYNTNAQWLVENNEMLSSYDKLARFGEARGATKGNAFQWAGRVILRNNQVLYGDLTSGSGGGCTNLGYQIDSRFYNNTFAKGSASATLNIKNNTTCPTSPEGMDNNKFVNNIFWRPGIGTIVENWDLGHVTARRIFWNNIFGLIGTAGDTVNIINTQNGRAGKTLSNAKADFIIPDDPDLRDRDVSLNPVTPPSTGVWNNTYNSNTSMVVDYASDPPNMTPVRGSALVDAGAPLTIVASGCGTSVLVVEDARWFYDKAGEFPGWMGVQYDTVRIGKTYGAATQAQLAGVNYATNMLTFRSAISCSNGDPVWFVAGSDGIVHVKGAGPDIGAVEFVPTLAPPANLHVQ